MISPETPWMTLVIYVAVAVGALLAFEGVRQVFGRGESTSVARNRRMRMIKKGASTEEVLSLLKKDLGKGGLFARTQATLSQSGLPISLVGFVLAIALLAASFFLIFSALLSAVLAVPLALALGLGLPWIIVLMARKKRLDKLVQQLPDALDLMSRGLKVGHPLNVTIASVASDMPDPIGTEFGLIQDQISYGDAVVDAFASFADRIDLEDVRYLSVSVGIQHGSGGNLVNVLQVLAKVIRDRATMKKRIVAISAEGRFSAFILSALPFGIFASISAMSPEYYGAVRDDPIFMPVMLGILSAIVLQAAILYKLVSFKF